MIIYGIDAGFTGAITKYWPAYEIIECYDMPTFKDKKKTLIDLPKLLQILTTRRLLEKPIVYLERVSAMPNQGVSSTFRFGQGYGQLEMGIEAAGLPLNYVSPAVWKKHFGLTKNKGESREKAERKQSDETTPAKKHGGGGRAKAKTKVKAKTPLPVPTGPVATAADIAADSQRAHLEEAVSNSIFILCKEEKWADISALIASNPTLAVAPMTMANNITTTILHQAITSKGDVGARAGLVKFVLSIRPSAAAIKNGYGSLPIHVLAQRNCKMKSKVKKAHGKAPAVAKRVPPPPKTARRPPSARRRRRRRRRPIAQVARRARRAS